MPVRVQRKRTDGWKKPENTVNVARPSKFGNPYDWREMGREEAVAKYRRQLEWQLSEGAWVLIQAVTQVSIDELRGKNLMCWCPMDQPCHADVLLELANRSTKEGQS